MPRALTLRPCAKINLTLRVGHQAADGFHDVQTILQAIDVSDALTFTPKRGPFVLKTSASDVPAGETNLVWRAARALWKLSGHGGQPRDAEVLLKKEVPVAAGLGGGSADAAAALIGLNRIWALHVPRPELLRLAATLGSDVPYFFVGGTAIGTGRGDEVYPLADIPPLGVVLIRPGFGVGTADAYRWLDEDRAKGDTGSGLAAGELQVGWPAGPIKLGNDLQAPVVRRHPEVAEMIQACLDAGATVSAMTGSGSAVFGVFSPSAAPKAARALRRPGWSIMETRTLRRAESWRRMGL